ncbi:MAG: hypothetical protein H6561_22795 [Lewinellaceae bacterium]|nr:hypothetical protein [Saprospiraceae bacterium]MCB9272370.1 hypothetical protein [Lewinellaceae bacterium]
MKELIRHAISLILYPITALFVQPVLVVRSFIKCLRLFEGDFRHFSMFSPLQGLNTYFYKTRALNIFTYGKSGKSPFIGAGDYELARTFHYTLPSLYPFAVSSNVTIILGLIGLCVTQIVWWPVLDSHFFFWTGMVAIILSTHFYTSFLLQNYNVLGWALYPLLVYAIFYWQPYLAMWALLGVSFFSFTGWFIGSILIGLFALIHGDFAFMLTLLPAALKILLLNMYPLFTTAQGKQIVINIAKAIGLVKTKTKYSRKKQFAKVRMGTIAYLIGLQLFFVLWVYYFHHEPAGLLLAIIGLNLANTLAFRFADDQTFTILFLIVGIATVFYYQDWWLMVPFWIANNPLPLALNIKSDNLFNMPLVVPFDTRSIQNGIEQFLSPISAHQRVLMANRDPEGSYERVFDGYRYLMELPFYVANERQFLLLPDWWAVFEFNYEGAPDFWCQEPEEVSNKMQEWNASAVIIYQDTNKSLDPKWEAAGFTPLTSLDWDDFTELKADKRLCRYGFPKWWLMKHQ